MTYLNLNTPEYVLKRIARWLGFCEERLFGDNPFEPHLCSSGEWRQIIMQGGCCVIINDPFEFGGENVCEIGVDHDHNIVMYNGMSADSTAFRLYNYSKFAQFGISVQILLREPVNSYYSGRKYHVEKFAGQSVVPVAGAL